MEGEQAEEEPVPETRIEVEIPKVSTDLGSDLYFVKLPNFLSVEPRLKSQQFCSLILSIFYWNDRKKNPATRVFFAVKLQQKPSYEGTFL